jgi:hypothetical protein
VQEWQAKRILEERLRAGGKLVVAQEGDLPSIRVLQDRCHEAGVPTMLGACAGG